jgi:putative membrane protein
MISFGFTIYKFFQYEKDGHGGGLLTPRDFSLIMISIGIIALLFATISHRREIKDLSVHLEHKHRSIAEIVAGIIAIFGVLALLATAFHS